MTERPVRFTRLDDGSVLFLAPSVGDVRDLPAVGDVVTPARPFAVLETLGQRVVLVAPTDVGGRVVERRVATRARVPVGYGTELVRIDPSAGADVARGGLGETSAGSSSLVFRAPMSGRFYARPSPTKAPLVTVGDVVETGHGVCLLEVMKTFNRVAFGGEGLPARARVVRVVPNDGDDVARGDVLLEIEPA